MEKNPEEFARVRLEEEVTSLANKHNIQIVILNPSLYIGPLCSKKLHGASIDLITNLLHGKQVDVAYPLVDVRDVAQAHIAAMEKYEQCSLYFKLWHLKTSLSSVRKRKEDIFCRKAM